MSCVGFHRIGAGGQLPCCMRLLFHGSRTQALYHSRTIHSSPASSAKNYLHKFSSKNKKRHWYDSTWHIPVENKPPGLLALMKPQQSERRRGENVRVKVLNGILYDTLTGLLSTSEVSEEVYDYCIEISKVSVSADFSVCRAYWLSSGNKDTDAEIDKLLQKSAPRFRHLMMSQHVLGNVPHVVFLRDKDDARRQEVEDLLAVLQSAEDVSSVEEDVSRKLDAESLKEASALHRMFGIDHAELNQQIIAYKKNTKAKVIATDSNEHSHRQEEQLAAIRKQNLQRKKMKKQNVSARDIGPQDYLLAREELNFQLHELQEFDEEEEPNDSIQK